MQPLSTSAQRPNLVRSPRQRPAPPRACRLHARRSRRLLAREFDGAHQSPHAAGRHPAKGGRPRPAGGDLPRPTTCGCPQAWSGRTSQGARHRQASPRPGLRVHWASRRLAPPCCRNRKRDRAALRSCFGLAPSAFAVNRSPPTCRRSSTADGPRRRPPTSKARARRRPRAPRISTRRSDAGGGIATGRPAAGEAPRETSDKPCVSIRYKQGMGRCASKSNTAASETMNRAPVRRRSSSARSGRMRRSPCSAQVGASLRSASTTVLPARSRSSVASRPIKRSSPS